MGPSKDELRREARRKRAALPADVRAEKVRQIHGALRALPAYQDARMILFYAAYGQEVPTRELVDGALAAGKRVALPRVDTAKREMQAVEVSGWDDLIPGPLGIPTPSELARVVDLQEIDLVVVPGIVFDGRGHRIGHGHGYYDRFLRRLRRARGGRPALCAGIAFAEQLVDRVPAASHDQAVDCVITY